MKNTVTYIIIIILLIILIINSLFAPQIREHFDISSNDQQALKSINICGRNLVFPYFSKNVLPASHRALVDNSVVQTTPHGLCRIDVTNTNNELNESYSIVQENSLFYNFKKVCLGFRIKDIYYDSELDTVFVTFLKERDTDIDNLGSFILLNPLYIEFAVDASHDTSGYRIAYEQFHANKNLNTNERTWKFSNLYTGSNTLKIPFKSISNKNSESVDRLFNYKDLSPNQKLLSNADINYLKTISSSSDSRVLNMKVYFIDKLVSSFQNIGRTLYLDYDKSTKTNGKAIIFDKTYQKTYGTDQAKYEFMNNIALMYSSYVYPIMTFDFDINVTKENLNGNKQMLCKVYMDNSLGIYGSCMNINDNSGGGNNNNIFAVSFEPDTASGGPNISSYYMNVFIGQDGNCNNGNRLSIQLPYLRENNNIQITLTVSPNEQLVLARWKDSQSNDVLKKYIYGKKNDCGDNPSYNPANIIDPNTKQEARVNNNLYKLFVQNIGESRIPLANIEMAYDKTYMKNIKTCTLGYVNLLNNLNGG